MVAGKSPFPPKPRIDETNTTASLSIECSPTSSEVEFQETHYQKRKLPSRQSIPFTGSCQEDDQRKRVKCNEYHFPSYQNLSSSPAVISRMPPSLWLFGANIVDRIPLPPMDSDQISTKCERFDESFDTGDVKNKPKEDFGISDLISRMPSSLRLFGTNIVVPTDGIPSPPTNSDQISTEYKLFNESLNTGDGKNIPKSDYVNDKSPFFTLLELPSSPLGKPTETRDLISRMPTYGIPIPTPRTNSHQISTKLTLFDESWDMRYGKINLAKFKGKLDHEEEVSTELKLYNDPWEIKKKITKNDFNSSLFRLELPEKPIEKYLKLYMKKRGITDEEIKEGIYMRVWDYDSETEHIVKFKKWDSRSSYVFGSNWKREFVERRGLQVEDEIGLFWDENKFRFGFRVLSRANNDLSCSADLGF